MKASDFVPLRVNGPPLAEGADILVLQMGAENHTDNPGIMSCYDARRRDSTLTKLYVGAWDGRDMEVFVPCNIADCTVETSFKGRTFITVRDQAAPNRIYRAFQEHAPDTSGSGERDTIDMEGVYNELSCIAGNLDIVLERQTPDTYGDELRDTLKGLNELMADMREAGMHQSPDTR